MYTIEANYNGTGNYTPSTDAGHQLTVTPATTTTSVAVSPPTQIDFSESGQNTPLLATVTSPAGLVGTGTVTFTLMNGNTPLGTPVTAPLNAGAANASYALPAATPTGSYTLQARGDFTLGTDAPPSSPLYMNAGTTSGPMMLNVTDTTQDLMLAWQVNLVINFAECSGSSRESLLGFLLISVQFSQQP